MIEIIPAIDLIDGKCVRLSQGDYNQKKVYNEDPLEVAKSFEDNGIKRLHLVDLDGAKSKHVVNHAILEKIAAQTKLTIDFGGGIKTNEDLKVVFDSGAHMATVGSIAVQQPDLFFEWLWAYSPEKIILGADVKDRKVAISGWYDVTDIELTSFVKKYYDEGVKNLLCTDISKDGMLQGASIDLYFELQEEFEKLNIIASGGITNISEIEQLQEKNIHGVIIGKALYEGRISLKDLQAFL